MRLSGLGLPAICGPVARLSAAQAGKKPQQYHVTAYSPGCGVNALPGLRAIGNLRYCSPDTRCAPSPGEEHGVAEFPGGDAAHLSGLPDGAQQAKKKPVLAYELFLKYGGEGGIDSLRSPLLGPSLGLAPAGPAQALCKIAPGNFVGADSSQARHLSNWLAPVVEPRSGLLIPPAGTICEKKARTCVRALLKIWR